jgi:hypothetical protein
MIRLLIASVCALALAGCVVAPPYAYAPAYGYAPGYNAAPSISVGVGGYYGGRGRW